MFISAIKARATFFIDGEILGIDHLTLICAAIDEAWVAWATERERQAEWNECRPEESRK